MVLDKIEMGVVVVRWVHGAFALLVVVVLAGCAPKHTVRTTYYPDGTPRWQVETRNDIPHGRSVTWHANGAKATEGHYRNGEPVGELQHWNEAGDPIDEPAVTAERTTAPPAPPPSKAFALHIGVGLGAGSAPPADPIDENDESPSGARLSFAGLVALRVGPVIAGGVAEWLETVTPLSGPGHRYLGGLVGVALGDRDSTVELAVEVGAHHIEVADGFAEGKTDRRYGGLRGGWWFSRGGTIAVGLSGAIRRDLSTGREELSVKRCFFSCRTETETWHTGGWNVALAFGVRFVVP